MGVRKLFGKIGDRAANRVSKLSALSTEQIEQINNNREEYLSRIPDPKDTNATELSNRLLAASSVEIFDLYLTQIRELYKPLQCEAELGESFDAFHNIRFLNITKWVTDQNENSLEKLVNVYDVLSKEECNIALVFNRTVDKTNVYLATVNMANAKDNINADNFRDRIKEAIQGNFPGSEWDSNEGKGRIPCLDNEKNYSVATATNIPTEKSEKFISQTIEKLLDGIIPDSERKEYTIILLATPVSDIQDRKMRLAEFYTGLSPYSSWQTNYTFTEAKSNTAMATFGVNIGTSAGSQQTQSIANTESSAETLSEARSVSNGQGASVGLLGVANANVNHAVTNTLGKALSTVLATTNAVAKGTTKALNLGASFSRASNVTATVGLNEGITQSYVNYNIKHTLEVLDKQMKRYETCTALGMWDFSVYVVSEDSNIANNVAHSYLALTQGQESYLSNAAVNLWRGDLGDNSADAREICKYVRDLRHPIFALDPEVVEEDASFYIYPPLVTCTTALSGKELAYSLNFPRKSLSGFPVLECAEFGRDIVSYDVTENQFDISIGKVFHMNHIEKNDVCLAKESLSSHVFITGSTGSGKSNTIYKILHEAKEKGVRFLVVEPAKGEYKYVFGKEAKVYGTNPKIMPLLRINPFSFEEGIHVLEHLDRLVEIFNVCWPMYAAMPAVLKSAIEKSYEDCGWDLISSTNEYGADLFPSFSDVARNVKSIMDSSEYDSENKGAYKGSLLTRIQSLCNGINGLIFNQNEIDGRSLFDENVVIDLSRVGSAETKSLIMGMLVLKLQEYRLVTSHEMNAKLKHITVLEEAHNILKRTASSHSAEGGDLIGKSVEMISNAIAEMRTYGEGFIIADQAPGLMDMSVIRNTNTKVIMRLPDQADRELVGKAANLNDDQISEISKLPRGVAALYQNEWVQPVLCKVDQYKPYSEGYTFETNTPDESASSDPKARIEIAKQLSEGVALGKEAIVRDIKPKLVDLRIDASVQVIIFDLFVNPPQQPRMTRLAPVMHALFPEVTRGIKKIVRENKSEKAWTEFAQRALRNIYPGDIPEQVRKDIIQGIMTYHLLYELNDISKLKDWSTKGGLA